MTVSSSPLHVWMHLGAELTRNLPQWLTDPAAIRALQQRLQQARQAGAEGIVVPISWRHVAPYRPEQVEDAAAWQCYQALFALIRDAGLQIVPDLSLVARGMRDVRTMTLLPDWLWGHLQQALPAAAPLDSLKYLDPWGRDSIIATSLWAASTTTPYFQRFLSGFATHLAGFSRQIPQLVLGIGPEGEWRYPFLGQHTGSGLQAHFPCFSQLALAQLRHAMLQQYGSLADWAQAWSLSTDQLVSEEALKSALLSLLAALQRGETSSATAAFYDWYQQSLTGYGQQLLHLAGTLFDGNWQHCQLGIRLPGRLPALHQGDALQAMQIAGFSAQALEGQGLVPVLEALLPASLRTRTRLLLTGVGLRHGEPACQLLQAWQTAASTLAIPLLAETSRPLMLEDLPQWEHLVQTVLHDPVYRGWVVRDLDSFMSSDIGAARLRQLSRLRHAQGLEARIRHREFRVMGPLHLKVANSRQLLSEAEWQHFADQIRQLRRMGVTAVSTDLWWGLIEGRQAGQFDWRYYDRLVALLAAHDMRWVPILSFHQAGGNVNDDFMQTIPLWLWGKLLDSHSELESVRDLQYVSETGDASMEYISLWADRYVLPYYQRFMEAFRDHFSAYAGHVAEVNLSLGPAGELRYPSYNAHDWGNYPNRGTLQCYSPLARQDWQQWLRQRYRTPEALNYAFGSRYRRFDEVELPLADALFDNRQYIYSAWAREFLGWYHQALAEHGRRILELGLSVFNQGRWQQVPVGIKIPGIHWEISDPDSPRVAEITAGLIRPHPTLGAQNQREYVGLLEQVVPAAWRSRVVVHFTCLEMINKDYEGYSRAADLVSWFAEAAHELGISLMGENALAGELYGESGWKQMAAALSRTPGFGGITLLRMQNFFDEDKTPKERLQWLINQFQ
mgnify:CR=1 FL=1